MDNKITLTDEQMKLVVQAMRPLQVCDSHGVVLGTIDPELSPEFIAELKRRAAAPGPRYTGEQVRRHLQSLEEAWNREGPFDERRMREILDKARAQDHK
jgi:hypothetical protein